MKTRENDRVQVRIDFFQALAVQQLDDLAKVLSDVWDVWRSGENESENDFRKLEIQALLSFHTPTRTYLRPRVQSGWLWRCGRIFCDLLVLCPASTSSLLQSWIGCLVRGELFWKEQSNWTQTTVLRLELHQQLTSAADANFSFSRTRFWSLPRNVHLKALNWATRWRGRTPCMRHARAEWKWQEWKRPFGWLTCGCRLFCLKSYVDLQVVAGFNFKKMATAKIRSLPAEKAKANGTKKSLIS